MTTFSDIDQDGLDKNARTFWQVGSSFAPKYRTTPKEIPLIDIVTPQPKTSAKVFYSNLSSSNRPKVNTPARRVQRKRDSR